ncbi:biotin--[acetyl-CoA-carboxylase] ligase [Planococcus lenghuensis]|uniref:Bifunctional ligase/repressor BirA n=1 Tax=Planococcus lenghuensis TaxID=2213202 RepID=A0A1Q2KZI2_9BACL|nr:biotin--[acetyl-CoA-carboxylase] ligase [Planococcus lenghuensis]AQQ53610.1 biotin--[acetyl-CoA-carboxylase] ligase [Planococcus lenghuensis]
MNTAITNQLARRLIKAGDAAISGQQFAEEFGISRTAVWKHIKELQEEGYDIQSVKKKGYFLSAVPDSLKPEVVQPLLETAVIGRNINYHETVTSTQIIAHQLAQDGAPGGTAVLAETQTAGRGRLARNWDSAAGKGIWMSIILRPAIMPQRAPQFTLVTAVAVVQAIEEVTGLRPEIKWPNDVLLNGRKCTGILTELQADMDSVQALIIGIGLNANQTQDDFDPAVREVATSLRMEGDKPVERAVLVRSIFRHLEKYTDLYIENGFAPLKVLWESYSVTIGKRIRARTAREVLEGLAIGITDDGVLELKTDDGKIHTIYSADIELAT